MTEPAEAQAGDAIPSDVLIGRLAWELAQAEQILSDLQALLTSIFSSADIDPSTLRDIQQLDLATQIIGNLSSLATEISAKGNEGMDPVEISRHVTLLDVGRRLSGHIPSERGSGPQRGHNPEQNNADAGDDGDIAWL